MQLCYYTYVLQTHTQKHTHKGNKMTTNNKQQELQANILEVLQQIYNGSIAGEYMIDNVADELGDYFNDVKHSKNEALKKAYAHMRNEGMEAEDDTQLMASIALEAINMLA